jgi:polyphosphate kinase
VTTFDDPALFINRELSMLAFQRRVLEEARDPSNPLFERLKFLCIVASNLDEFFMVRLAGVKDQLKQHLVERSVDGQLPAEQLKSISEAAHALMVVYEETYLPLREALADLGQVKLLSSPDLDAAQQNALREEFQRNVFPALTPLAVDPGHPFPQLRNKSLNVALFLRRKQNDARPARKTKKRNAETTITDATVSLAVVQVPQVMSRWVPVLQATQGMHAFLPLEELIAWQAAELFPGFEVVESCSFRVTRNWDIAVDEEEKEDLLEALQEELRRRDRGAAIRLEMSFGASLELERTLRRALRVEENDVYRLRCPLQLQDMLSLSDTNPRPELRLEPLVSAQPAAFRSDDSVFPVIRERDVLIHHPYESFDPVVRFVEEAADDPNVLAIKQTLYRTSWNSPFVRALSRAAENGKQVTVLVEIKARFDEANNIAWARRLEEAGVHVVYGLIGLKTHCKVALVVRREGNTIQRYIHLGTGNYNPSTAKIYTDISMFTARADYADDVSGLFNMLTGLSDAPRWKRFTVAPLNLRERLLFFIQREADKATRGEPARIIAKMNALVDPTIIKALYAASCSGVEIDLLVRGMCALRPGVVGVSERIRVTSIVDRFLEHHRIFTFGVGAQTDVFLSSADWMTRNFARRIEIMFPVEDAGAKSRVIDEILQTYLKDNVKAHRLQPDGSWLRIDAGDQARVRSQQSLLHLAYVVDAPRIKWGETNARLSLTPRPALGS